MHTATGIEAARSRAESPAPTLQGKARGGRPIFNTQGKDIDFFDTRGLQSDPSADGLS